METSARGIRQRRMNMPDQSQFAVIDANQARVNITYAGQNGDLPDPVSFDATAEQVRAWATEAVRAGGVPGIRADAGADFTDFVVDRFEPTAEVPFSRLMVRPKTPFGV